MKIDLEEPFKSIWNNGYLRVGSEERQIVDLFNSNSDRTTISYARYLMSVHLGYIVPDEYEVDHVDNDKTNDDINNLQLLTPEQNKIKKQLDYFENKQICYGVHCAYCSIPFIITERDLKCRLAKNVEYAFCSRRCAGLYHTTVSRRSNQSK